MSDGGEIVAVGYLEHSPAVGLEAAGDVLGKGERRVAVDGDVVVVVDDRQLSQSQVAGERGGLTGNAFHQVAVAGEHPGPVIHDGVAGTVEVIRQEPLGDGHPYGVAEALTQWTGGGLHTRRMSALRVAGCTGAPLAEVSDVVEREIVAAQMQ
jgi:hypothetical protein